THTNLLNTIELPGKGKLTPMIAVIRKEQRALSTEKLVRGRREKSTSESEHFRNPEIGVAREIRNGFPSDAVISRALVRLERSKAIKGSQKLHHPGRQSSRSRGQSSGYAQIVAYFEHPMLPIVAPPIDLLVAREILPSVGEIGPRRPTIVGAPNAIIFRSISVKRTVFHREFYRPCIVSVAGGSPSHSPIGRSKKPV